MTSLEKKIDRLHEIAALRDPLSQSLLHAYAACLSFRDLCTAVLITIPAESRIRHAILSRLRRLMREACEQECLDKLATDLLELKRQQPKLRVRVNSILSRLVLHLNLECQHEVLTSWKGEHQKDSAARWLNAIAENEKLFEPSEILAYWRSTRDWRAAKLLVFNGSPTLLADVLPEIVAHCALDEGWIAARAAIKATVVVADTFAVIREKFPASYAYICAKTGHSLTHDEAMSVFFMIKPAPFELNDPRGLAIWSFGHLGMWDTLDHIRELVPGILEDDAANMMARF